MSPSDSTHAVERRKAPRQINDLATMCSRSDPVPQWDIWHILPQLELNLLAYSLLFNKVVCLDPPSRSASSLGLLGQPGMPLLPSPRMAVLPAGSKLYTPSRIPRRTFRPPLSGGALLAVRRSSVAKSISCKSTTRPALRN